MRNGLELFGYPSPRLQLLVLLAVGNPDINRSTTKAAGKAQKSHSWRKSGSAGRACGSVYATAIINKLVKNSHTATSIVYDDSRNDLETATETLERQEDTFVEFSRAVYHTLLHDVDRRGITIKCHSGCKAMTGHG